MRKIRMVLLMLFVLSSALLAIDKASSKGFFAGINFANVTGTKINNNEQVTGYKIGGFLTKQVGKTFYLQFESMFSTKGWKFKNKYQDDQYSNKMHFVEEVVTLNYIQLGMLGKVVEPVSNRVNINMLFGPMIGINTYAYYDYEHIIEHTLHGEVNTVVYKSDGEITDINSIDLGAVIGFGLTVYNVFLEARYELGFSEVIDPSPIEPKNSVLSLMIGYVFE